MGSSATCSLTHDKRLVVTKDDETSTLDMTTRPRFLEKLEVYLKNELHRLGVTEVKPSEVRLKVYRQVFDAFIKNFTSYSSLLSAIKTEYDMMLHRQSQKIRRLDPLQKTLISLSIKCTTDIENYSIKDNQAINSLKRTLRKQSDMQWRTQLNKMVLEKEVHRLKDLLSKAYNRNRFVQDQCKLFATDVDALQFMMRDNRDDVWRVTSKLVADARRNLIGSNTSASKKQP
ncbi:translin-associated factor X-interacting protein 1-like [Gigantopelta aegis]|uniref:translin-associated factor X-interacting protein 1-like n=1 Tax=Gigantopelta aegis TaxID=1735272 RepID=UPI001B88B0DB|nr:translin-associated factor X-interacting protein 1-like [Gigantopelta aegis]